MIGLGNDVPVRGYEIARVRVKVLPEPVEVRLTLVSENGAEIPLAPVQAGIVLPGLGEPTSWGAALVAELTAAVGLDPTGLDVRHLDRLLSGLKIRARLLERDGVTYLLAVRGLDDVPVRGDGS